MESQDPVHRTYTYKLIHGSYSTARFGKILLGEKKKIPPRLSYESAGLEFEIHSSRI